MHKRFTCESGCWIVREQIPDKASQNLVSYMLVPSSFALSHTEGCVATELSIPDGVVVASCNWRLATSPTTANKGPGSCLPVQRITDMMRMSLGCRNTAGGPWLEEYCSSKWDVAKRGGKRKRDSAQLELFPGLYVASKACVDWRPFGKHEPNNLEASAVSITIRLLQLR